MKSVRFRTVPFTVYIAFVQLDQINIAVFFLYLVKSDLSSVRYFTRIHWTSHFLQGTIKTLPCLTGICRWLIVPTRPGPTTWRCTWSRPPTFPPKQTPARYVQFRSRVAPSIFTIFFNSKNYIYWIFSHLHTFLPAFNSTYLLHFVWKYMSILWGVITSYSGYSVWNFIGDVSNNFAVYSMDIIFIYHNFYGDKEVWSLTPPPAFLSKNSILKKKNLWFTTRKLLNMYQVSFTKRVFVNFKLCRF